MRPPNSQEYRQGVKAYRNGFLLGALIGIVICIVLHKAIWTLPLVLGLFSGAVAINRKI